MARTQFYAHCKVSSLRIKRALCGPKRKTAGDMAREEASTDFRTAGDMAREEASTDFTAPKTLSGHSPMFHGPGISALSPLFKPFGFGN